MKSLRPLSLGLLCCFLTFLFASLAQSAPCIAAIWVDGYTDSGGNNVDEWLKSFGCSTKFVTNSEIDTPGFLDGFNVIFVTRHSDSFGTSLDTQGSQNVKAFVAGSSGATGGVFVFLNDWLDNNPFASGGDPHDPNTSEVMQNAILAAAATGHGYVGELNGASMALESNQDGFVAMGLVRASATSPEQVIPCAAVGQVMKHDIGIGNFMPLDNSCFGINTTGIPLSNAVYFYIDGEAAVVTNHPNPPTRPGDNRVTPGAAVPNYREGGTTLQ